MGDVGAKKRSRMIIIFILSRAAAALCVNTYPRKVDELTRFEGMKVCKASLLVRIRKLSFKSTRSEKLSHTVRSFTLLCAAVCAANQVHTRA